MIEVKHTLQVLPVHVINPQANQEGGIIEREASIHVSNLALLNPTTKRADRVGIKTLEDGKKVRYFKSSGEIVDVDTVG